LLHFISLIFGVFSPTFFNKLVVISVFSRSLLSVTAPAVLGKRHYSAWYYIRCCFDG